MSKAPRQKDKRSSRRASLSKLEADVAFFDARRALIGDRPRTRYQRAQIKAYETLERLFGAMLQRVKAKKRLEKTP